MEKTCRGCHSTKPLSEFHTHPQMRDGHLNFCKACFYEKTKAYRKTAAGIAARKKEKQYPESKRRYKRTARGRAQNKRYEDRRRKLRPERIAAKEAVRYALRTGALVKQRCFMCGKRAVAHHPSYDRDMRLAVAWLCVFHHNQTHIDHAKSIA